MSDMPGIKRLRDGEDEIANGDDVHHSRKRRLDHGKVDTHLATIYSDLADDIQTVRLKAAGALLKTLSAKSPDRSQRIKDSLGRLVRGLCSGRKAARLGFSVALSEVLRLAFELAISEQAEDFKLDVVTAKVIALTQADGKVRGQELRDHLLGRRFAFQAILQSNIALDESTTDKEWRTFVDAVVDLAAEKPWIRSECGAMLYEYFEGVIVSTRAKERAQTMILSLHEKGLTKTPEGVALWLSISDRFPKLELPRGVWHSNNPLAPEETIRLKKVLHGNVVEEDGPKSNGSLSGLRQSQPSFAWKVILSRLHTKEGKAFQHFWTDAVEHGLFATGSSNERKSLGLQIVSMAFTTAPAPQLKHILSNNIMHCIVTQRAEGGRYLFEAVKVTLSQIVSRIQLDTDPESTVEIVETLLGAAVNFDQLTKTKTIESILGQASPLVLKSIVPMLKARILKPTASDASSVDMCRRTLAAILLDIAKSHQDPASLFREKSKSKDAKLEGWVHMLLQVFVEVGYCKLDQSAAHPLLSDAQRSWFRARLMSHMTLLLQLPMEKAVVPIDITIDLLRDSDTQVYETFKKETKSVLATANKLRSEAQKLAKTGDMSTKVAMQAYQLLFALSTLQVYNEERESVDVLKDLCSSFQDHDGGSTATAMIVEILLSFLSKPSTLFRKLAEQVFTTFAPEITAESMQSLLDILQQKEGLSGQQELFADHGDESHEDEDDKGEDASDESGEVIDVEDDSDIEIVNGEVVEAQDDGSSEGNTDETSDAESDKEQEDEEEDEDEETAFDRKLADALGTQGMEGDTDSDGSDMDDEQMMALDGHLITIFKERSKQSNKKQDNKDAKENIVHFKNRVLDLLSIYVKTQCANPLALQLILPLTSLVRTTSSKPTSEKAFAVLKQYFEACTKHKHLPVPSDPEDAFTILTTVHTELALGGSKLHANACSRASLFVAKVVVALDERHYTCIADMYATLQSEWYLDPKSKVLGSVFTEWTSWSLTTRKAR